MPYESIDEVPFKYPSRSRNSQPIRDLSSRSYMKYIIDLHFSLSACHLHSEGFLFFAGVAVTSGRHPACFKFDWIMQMIFSACNATKSESPVSLILKMCPRAAANSVSPSPESVNYHDCTERTFSLDTGLAALSEFRRLGLRCRSTQAQCRQSLPRRRPRGPDSGGRWRVGDSESKSGPTASVTVGQPESDYPIVRSSRVNLKAGAVRARQAAPHRGRARPRPPGRVRVTVTHGTESARSRYGDCWLPCPGGPWRRRGPGPLVPS